MRDLIASWSWYKEVFLVLTVKEIKVRYKSSVLGYFWSIANPLAFAFVFYVAFKVVMRIQIENYTVFLLSGLFAWQWFSNSVNASSMVFLANVSLIKKITFPRELLVLAMVSQDFLHFLLSIPVIVLFLLVYHLHPTVCWLYQIPILLIIQMMTTYGISLFVSSINLFFRDMEKIVTLVMMFVFYMTPIIYSETMIPPGYRSIVMLNPIAPLMISWRDVFLKGTLSLAYVAVAGIYASLFMFIGMYAYRRLSWKFAEVL